MQFRLHRFFFVGVREPSCDTVEAETTSTDAPPIVGVGDTAYDVLRDTPETVHGLERVHVEDPVFSTTFHLFSSDP